MNKTIRRELDNVDLVYRASQVLFAGSLVTVAYTIFPEAKELLKDGIEFAREGYWEVYQRVIGFYM